MNRSDWKGILALAVVTVLAVGLMWGTTVLTRQEVRKENGQELISDRITRETAADSYTEELPADGYKEIQKAVKKISGDGRTEGYEVSVSVQGYQGPILLTAFIDAGGGRLEKLEVTRQQETETLGGKIAEDSFLDQFKDIPLPVSLATATVKNEKQNPQADTKPAEEPEKQTDGGTYREDALDWKELRDGRYEAFAKEYQNGFLDTLTMTVSKGRVTELVWNAVDENGGTKRILADKGEYVMKENGLTWTQQADALAAQVISHQSLDFLIAKPEGNVDEISGVSISAAPFLTLARRCLIQAGAVPKEKQKQTLSETGSRQTEETKIESDGQKTQENTSAGQEKSQVDGISGATISSAAVVRGVNQAYEFIHDNQ